MTQRLSPLQQLASRINAHLKRFEGDPAINTYGDDPRRGGTKPYAKACAYSISR